MFDDSFDNSPSGRRLATVHPKPHRSQLQQFLDLQEEVDRLPKRLSGVNRGRIMIDPMAEGDDDGPFQVAQRVAPPRRHYHLSSARAASEEVRSDDAVQASEGQRERKCSTSPKGSPSCSESALNELKSAVPLLSAGFYCSEADAITLLLTLRSLGQLHRDADPTSADRISSLEVERKTLLLRIEKRNDECDRLKDELGSAKEKLRAVQQQATQSSQLLSQKRDEARKHLLIEEGRTQKLQQQNKLLAQELERLKEKMHMIMKS